MALNPKPPAPGPVRFEYRHGADFVAPFDQVRPTRVDIPPGILPDDIPIDTTYDPAAIIATERIPRVLPIFLGMRQRRAERKVARYQSELEGHERARQVSRYVGRTLLQNVNYNAMEVGGQPNEFRPTSEEEVEIANKLSHMFDHRRVLATHVYGLYRPYDQSAESPTSTRPGSTTLIPGASKAEREHIRRSRRVFGKVEDELSDLDHEFTSTINEPVRKAEKTVRKRNKAAAKLHALEEAQARRAAHP